jgi:hypothetical protein
VEAGKIRASGLVVPNVKVSPPIWTIEKMAVAFDSSIDRE